MTDEPPQFEETDEEIVVDISPALAAFADDLEKADELFSGVEATGEGRLGCMWALKATIDFCDALGWSADRRRPLFQLYLALQTASNGTIDPLLSINQQAGGITRPLFELQQRGLIAAAVEAMKRDGKSLEVACRWVANRVGSFAVAARSKVVLWKAVRSWRIIAMNGNSNENEDAAIFKTACEQFIAGQPAGEAMAKHLISQAAKLGKLQTDPPSN